ncbi:hypothetical protein Lal_00028323 [Lupinus albus]|nr:hypothetical protein Lal_00028323 [Lupinus albus]
MHAVFVEKVLRVQPEINKLYLLLRASNSDMASQRLQNETQQVLARVWVSLRDGSELLTVISAAMVKGKFHASPVIPYNFRYGEFIPVDMVINCVITAIVTHSNQASKNFIYHVSSSSRNPMRIMHVLDLSYRYFTKTPFMNKRGKPVIISKGVLLRSMDAFNKYITIRYVLPLKVLNLGNKLFCMFFQDLYDNSHQKIRIVKLMAKLYKPYVFFEAVFDDTNTEKLRMETKVDSNMEVGVLDFDPTSIDWTEYMMNVHIPGLVKYAMK